MSTQQSYAERSMAITARSLKAAQERPVAAAIVQVIEMKQFEDLSVEGFPGFAFRVPEVQGLTDPMVDELIAARKAHVNKYENVRRATEDEVAKAEAGAMPVISTGHNGKWLVYTF